MTLRFALPSAALVALAGCTAAPPRVDSTSLSHTTIVPALDAAPVASANVLWCASFELAWNGLQHQAGEPVKLADPPPCVEALDAMELTERDVSRDATAVFAGRPTAEAVEKTRADLRRLDMESAILAPSDDPRDVSLFAALSKTLRFRPELEKLDGGLVFQPEGATSGTTVRAFGLDRSKTPERSRQIGVSWADAGHFVATFHAADTSDEVLLAMIPRPATLSAGVAAVADLLRAHPERPLFLGSHVAVPVISFHVAHTFGELEGKRLLNARFAPAKIESARQEIEFLLDEKGAVLRSSASIVVRADAGEPVGDTLVFDRPFLVVLRQANAHHPYFALWVANPELLRPTTAP